MNFSAKTISYKDTGSFSPLINGFLSGDEGLMPFLHFSNAVKEVPKAIEARKKFPVNRTVLKDALEHQYERLGLKQEVRENLNALISENTFTICTAHQPNIFTGHLYFVYKILHVIKLSQKLKSSFPEYNFVPVYYMGNEDADLEELGQITVQGKKYSWKTDQKGAVGKMTIDKPFVEILSQLNNQLGVLPFGNEVMDLVQKSYVPGSTIEEATFHFVDALFGKYGLVVLIPDAPRLKELFSDVVRKEINEQFSAKEMEQTSLAFPQKYHQQAMGRELNLFYLDDSLRERIELTEKGFLINGTERTFSKEEIDELIKTRPEVFSPNVVLRPVYQERILPNILFVGGGGEIAYWLQLKNVFDAAGVFYPILLLRNSFSVLSPSTATNIKKESLTLQDIFKPVLQLHNEIISKKDDRRTDTTEISEKIGEAYSTLKDRVAIIDPTLTAHVEALLHLNREKILNVEKKMKRKLRRQHIETGNRLSQIRENLFPGGTLQERVDNILIYLSTYGFSFIDTLLNHSQTFEQQFTILTPKN